MLDLSRYLFLYIICNVTSGTKLQLKPETCLCSFSVLPKGFSNFLARTFWRGITSLSEWFSWFSLRICRIDFSLASKTHSLFLSWQFFSLLDRSCSMSASYTMYLFPMNEWKAFQIVYSWNSGNIYPFVVCVCVCVSTRLWKWLSSFVLFCFLSLNIF